MKISDPIVPSDLGFDAPTVLVVVDKETENITCWPNPVVMGEGGGYMTITFILLAPPGYYFPSTGAVVLMSASSQFPIVSWTQPISERNKYGLIVKLFNFNSNSTEYHYTVSVSGPALVGPAVGPDSMVEQEVMRLLTLSVDPGIQNGR